MTTLGRTDMPSVFIDDENEMVWNIYPAGK